MIKLWKIPIRWPLQITCFVLLQVQNKKILELRSNVTKESKKSSQLSSLTYQICGICLKRNFQLIFLFIFCLCTITHIKLLWCDATFCYTVAGEGPQPSPTLNIQKTVWYINTHVLLSWGIVAAASSALCSAASDSQSQGRAQRCRWGPYWIDKKKGNILSPDGCLVSVCVCV